MQKLGLKGLVAMGVGGMVEGGIFSVLGLSVPLAGHAAPIAFGRFFSDKWILLIIVKKVIREIIR